VRLQSLLRLDCFHVLTLYPDISGLCFILAGHNSLHASIVLYGYIYGVSRSLFGSGLFVSARSVPGPSVSFAPPTETEGQSTTHHRAFSLRC
jgi:hypothetical protein